MHHHAASAWIFAALVLNLALLFLYHAPWFVLLSMFSMPGLILLQACVVLRASEKPAEHDDDAHWYERS